MNSSPVEVEISLLGCPSSWQGASSHFISSGLPALIFIQNGNKIAAFLSLSLPEPLSPQVDASLVLSGTTPGLKGEVALHSFRLPASSSTHIYEFFDDCHLVIQNKASQINNLIN
jgi:hypothetical protein